MLETSEADWAWVPLYGGSWLCFSAIMLTRQMYKLSPGFRKRLRNTRFFEVNTAEASEAEMASVMLDAFRCYPATVSEMVEDSASAHGMVFRALMVTGGLAATGTRLGQLSAPASGGFALLLGTVHALRTFSICSVVGFSFAPSGGPDYDVSQLRDELAASPRSAKLQRGSRHLRDTVPWIGAWIDDAQLKALSDERRELLTRTAVAGMIHMVLAFLMLSVLPALELIVLLWDAHSFAPAIRACSPWALAWSALAAVRLLHIGCIAGCLNYFLFFFYSGFLNPNFASSAAFYKGFWAEFAAARMFAQLMILAAAASWFVPHYQQDGSPLLFDERPLAGRAVAVAVAAAHGASFGRFALRSAWKSLRNLEYSEAELASLLLQWRRAEGLFQSLLDAYLLSLQALQSTLTADGSGPEGLAAQLCRLLRGGSRGPPEASPPERQRAGGQQGSRPGEAGRSGAEGGLTMLRRQLSWARQFRGALKMHDE
mmetsp:Transcript_36246/g.111150  ORF Transcript_36246/g.111150 Transcript_36246/m.111150 type:complete len:485 (+) Transcript_36246:550-2004(+)